MASTRFSVYYHFPWDKDRFGHIRYRGCPHYHASMEQAERCREKLWDIGALGQVHTMPWGEVLQQTGIDESMTTERFIRIRDGEDDEFPFDPEIPGLPPRGHLYTVVGVAVGEDAPDDHYAYRSDLGRIHLIPFGLAAALCKKSATVFYLGHEWGRQL